jgi:hypothetical protein
MTSRVAATAIAALVLTGCGLDVQSPDLFQVTRSGAQRRPVTLLVNDSGTISCDHGKPKQLPDPLLLEARDLSTSLNNDVKAKLRFHANARSVFSYAVKVQNGTLSFPDIAASARKELAQLELFVVEAAASPCGLAS